MPRYFIEVSYKGINYAGFQVQLNANSIQAEIEKSLKIYFKIPFNLTGSSRTDAGVHALSNFFHFDTEALTAIEVEFGKVVYHLNAILPSDIVIHRIYAVPDQAHCRFDAQSREYRYNIYQCKDPFQSDRAYYYPYKLQLERLNQAAKLLYAYKDFTSFSKRNTQVKNFNCRIMKSEWKWEGSQLTYCVKSNRFLRGMVRGLVGTMLKCGTGKLSVKQFAGIVEAKDCSGVDFSVPAHGLFLVHVEY